MGMPNADFDKYMEGDITGYTALLALEKVLKRWHEISKEPYAEWLYTSLRTDPALQVDWAKAMQEAITERGIGNREWLAPEVPEEYRENMKKRALQEEAESKERKKQKDKSSS
jgi:hypothetical protein